MRSIDDVLAVLKPRTGDQTRLIPVKSKVEQDAIIHNAHTTHLIDPKSTKPGKSLQLFHPYYRVVEPDLAQCDEFDTDNATKPLYEYLHLPNARMLHWMELAKERKKAKAQSLITCEARNRTIHREYDEIRDFNENGNREWNPKTELENPHDAKETAVSQRLPTLSSDSIDKMAAKPTPMILDEDFTHRRAVLSSDSRPRSQPCSFPSQADSTSASQVRHATPIYSGVAEKKIDTNLLQPAGLSTSAREAHEFPRDMQHVDPICTARTSDSAHSDSGRAPSSRKTDKQPFPAIRHDFPGEEPDSQLGSPPYPPLGQRTAVLSDMGDSQNSFARTHAMSQHPEVKPHDASAICSARSPPSPLTVNGHRFTHPINATGIIDLDTEQRSIRQNYEELTKMLVAAECLRTAFIPNHGGDFALHHPFRLGSDEIVLSNGITSPDGRKIYFGRTLNEKRFLLLYPWRDGASWETARAWKALNSASTPESLRLAQFLRGSHSLVEKGSAVLHGENQLAYVQSGLTMLTMDAPIYPLAFFLAQNAPTTVIDAIFNALFGFYRSLVGRRIVHHFLHPETIFVSVRQCEEKLQAFVFPMLWDYSVDRSMFSDRRAQFVSSGSGSVYTNASDRPYEGCFADLMGMYRLIAATDSGIAWQMLLKEKADLAEESQPGYAVSTTASFFTILQAGCAYDVDSVREFITESECEDVAM